MRTILLVFGAIAILVGAVWVLQGSNILTGSAMSGSSLWLALGAVLLVVGVVLAAFGVRSPSKAKTA